MNRIFSKGMMKNSASTSTITSHQNTFTIKGK